MKLRQARKIVKEVTHCYAVVIKRKDGSEFFASGSDASRALFYKRADALNHADMHAEACKWPRKKFRVVKVTATIVEKGPTA